MCVVRCCLFLSVFVELLFSVGCWLLVVGCLPLVVGSFCVVC